MKKCSKIEEMIINGDLELDLAVETNEIVDEHLRECAECSSFVSELKRVSLELKNVKKLKVSDNFEYNMKKKLDAAKLENQQNETKVIPFFTKMVYYAGGVAAMIIAFVYVSSMGIFENNDNKIVPSSPAVQLVSGETENKTKTTIADSLENLRENVSNDENLRLKVNAGE